jgi:uncharacterized protein YodC (DUF2158 family)
LSNKYPNPAISSELFRDRKSMSAFSANYKHMESPMMLTKQATIATVMTLGIALIAPSATTALADPALPDTAMQSHVTSQFHNGDLVHLRSGGPLMTVTGIQGDQVTCTWNEGDGDLRSGHFPVAMLAAPIILPDDSE